MKLRAILLLLGILAPVRAQDFDEWVRALEARKVQVSAGVWELDTGALIEGHGTDQALVPASTTKVLSTYALLKTWKPSYMLETEVWGDLVGDTIQGDLILKGGGDPFLVSERVWMLAQQLKRSGVAKVQGRLKLDQSAFDGQPYGPGWENTSADTTPPILPLSVNFNRDEQGRIARDPEAASLEVIRSIFHEVGIIIEGKELKAGEPKKITAFASPPLRELVENINKFSNNFMAEMLVKRFGNGSWPAAAKRIQDFYQQIFSLGPDKVQITDGSGLSKQNRLSARTLAIVLRGAWFDFEVGPEMVNSLKIIGGEYWKQRVQDPNLTRRVRCKTGHLDEVETVCGYIQMPDGELRVFAILLNGPCTHEDVWGQVSRWAN